MKFYSTLLVSVVMCMSATLYAAEPVVTGQQSGLSTQKEKISYIIGLDIGKSVKNDGIDLDPEKFYLGLQDGIADKKSLLSTEEVNQATEVYQKEMKEKQAVQRAKQVEENTKIGKEYLEKNKKNKGVVVLPSGLQYKVVTPGKGVKPKATDKVRVHYSGKLIDGTEFDSSYKRNQPAEFPVNGVIKGWVEALQLMTVGSKWELCIPSDLAYGERGAGGSIPPNAVLLFTVELLEIVK
ncbi:MAG: FKBP-type peptidyl-prolyl cis-trans isomerase [Elusimicrobiota bacterium]